MGNRQAEGNGRAVGNGRGRVMGNRRAVGDGQSQAATSTQEIATVLRAGLKLDISERLSNTYPYFDSVGGDLQVQTLSNFCPDAEFLDGKLKCKHFQNLTRICLKGFQLIRA